jgi:Uma2 family endonuclease
MTDPLDLPEVREQILRISVEEYHRQPESPRTELLRGLVLRKTPKSPLHCFVVEKLREILESQIPPGFAVFQYGPLTLADSEPEPDLSIVRGSPADFRRAHPTTAVLVVEVAVSSLSIDRLKALIYAEAGVKEYWIVCPEERRVEVYRQPTPQGYAERMELAPATVLVCEARPGVRVDLAQFLR